MSDPSTKYILLALAPIIFTILLVLLSYLAIRFDLKSVIDSVNGLFWDLKDCYVYGASRGKVLGERLFMHKLSVKYVNIFLLYGAANAFGLIFTIWWRIIFFDISTDSQCIKDLDCFSTETSNFIGFPKYEPCLNISQTFSESTVLFCLRFSIPTIDALFVRVGVAYGFTAIIFSIIRFIMKFNAGPKANKTISIISIVLLIVIIVLMVLLIAFLKAFSAWLAKSLINYIIPFMIVLCIIVAFILFGCMNRKLAKYYDPFNDGDLVYYIRKKD
jgi:hypothetical protein